MKNLFLIFIFWFSFSSCGYIPLRNSFHQVCWRVGGGSKIEHCIDVEVVQKENELVRGLQFRDSLAPNAGMLFIFPFSRIYPFWMKDTKIPLDMIWMDQSGRIVYIEKNVPPCRQDPCLVYTPGSEALTVLEINSGYSDFLGLKIGDRARFK